MSTFSRRSLLLKAPLAAFGARTFAQTLQLSQPSAAPQDAAPIEYVCPMDPDIRSNTPGVCPRCGMKLIPGIAERIEYPVDLELSPKPVQAGKEAKFTFAVRDPKNGTLVTKFETVHERIFHLFVISQDLESFVHEHPAQLSDGRFEFTYKFPKPALYRVLTDFWPSSGTPQLVEKTLIVPGNGLVLQQPQLKPSLEPHPTENTSVEIVTELAVPIAGQKTMVFFRMKPNTGHELYLGAPAHMLAASSDLIDMIHTHPVQVSEPPDRDYRDLQFNVYFPRGTTYRLWIQFQRESVVNTAVFTVPVAAL